MTISGDLLLGATSRFGANGNIQGVDAVTGAALPGSFGGASIADVNEAVDLAVQASAVYRETSLEQRAVFLEAIAQNILDIGDELIARCIAESGLPRPRIEGERGRTIGQLRMFASVVRQGAFLGARIDPAQPDRKPMPRVDLRLRNVPLGPVVVFGASNFPLAFSVAGGDTASVLAAGCPVIVKAHSAHPGTSALVGKAIQQAVAAAGLPGGVFSLLFDAGYEVGQALVAHKDITAVGFTGSRAGGLALMKIAAGRKRPIPVYAEMSSINPVILFPAALQARGAAIGKAFVGALTMGAGQFCTNPGLVLGVQSEGLDAFVSGAAEALTQAAPQPMLTSGIHKNYSAGVERFAGNDRVELVARGVVGPERQAQAALFSTSAEAFLADHTLQEEVFGPVSLVVRARDWQELERVIDVLEGQLSVALHIDPADQPAAGKLLPKLEDLAGRLLVNGFGTGVEVGHAMVHGGPFPATSDGRTTSVGSLAIDRFLRPVSYQDFPEALLPPALQQANPLKVGRSIDGAAVA